MFDTRGVPVLSILPGQSNHYNMYKKKDEAMYLIVFF